MSPSEPSKSPCPRALRDGCEGTPSNVRSRPRSGVSSACSAIRCARSPVAKLEELGMNPGRTPVVLARHASNERGDIRLNARPSDSSRFPPPIASEARAIPCWWRFVEKRHQHAHPTTVSGFTMMIAFDHPDQNRRSNTQNARSAPRTLGLGRCSLNTASCWRSAAFSIARPACERTRAWMKCVRTASQRLIRLQRSGISRAGWAASMRLKFFVDLILANHNPELEPGGPAGAVQR